MTPPADSPATARGATASSEQGDSGASPFGLRTTLGGLGSLVALAGLLVVLVPSLGAQLPLGYGLVTLIGVGLLLVSGRWWVRLFLRRVEAAAPPRVEDRTTVSVPGAGFDRAITNRRLDSVSQLRAREAIEERIRAVATRVLEDGPTDPERALREGTWTDDATAAALFSASDPDSGWRTRFAALGSGETDFQRQVTRAVAELARRFDGTVEAITLTAPSGASYSQSTTPSERPTNRWLVLKPMALSAIGISVVFGLPRLLLVGAVVAGFGVYTAAGSRPGIGVTIARSVEPSEPAPGEAVRVTIEVTNESGRFLPDLRIVDRVPDGLTVVEGTPRHGMSIRPGRTETLSYTVEAARGSHTFEGAYVISRNLPGSIERVAESAVDGADTVTYDVRDAGDLVVPLRKQASRTVGRVLTDIGGSGIEFHSVREYRTGDPLKRIDWNRAAAGGQLATLQFREERSATVVLALDTRSEAYVAADPGGKSAVDVSVLAAAETVSSLLRSDDRVGLAALSPRACWLSPSGGQAHRARAHALLASHDAFGPTPPTRAYKPAIRLPTLQKRLPADAQLVVFSPLCDDEIVSVLRRLQASGHRTTVVSPDMTGGETPGRTLARIERQLRLQTLRRAGVRVVDWSPADPLALALSRAQRRWSA